MVRRAGAKKVYLASASPPVVYPNVYGVDMPSRKEFVANGLTIDHLTLRDGNCGPDAILRNLERLQPANDKSSNILGLLAKSDRHIAIKAMRLMLLIWIQANRSQELLEGSTIEQFRRWMARASVRTQPACARWAAGSTL